MDDIVKEFLVESHENLDRLDRDLVNLEKDPHQEETLGGIFRTIHSLKGTSGFLGYGKLEAVTHVAENLLSKLRDGVLVINPAIADALLATVDAVRVMLGEIEKTGDCGDGDFSKLIDRLTALNGGAGDGHAPKPPPPPTPPVFGRKLTPAIAKVPEPIPAPAPVVQPPTPVATAEPTPAPAPAAEVHEARVSTVSDSSVRVDVGVLDKLMNLVGELVLTRNQMLQFGGRFSNNAFNATSQRLNLITTELQSSVMKTRMQPIGNVWSKLPRVVRDLASQCGKEVRLEMEGAETELDKTIIEAIKDPLTHIVRNAIDHGVETPEVREQAGKPREGCLRMRAYHEGGQVKIEITDDGAGIDAEKVKAKALQRGLITLEESSRMAPAEAFRLIFLPGFSTAQTITNVSGRGVGMDVVKTNIEKIGGLVEVASELGKGATLKLKIPLTLAIIPALLVGCDGDRFAIPQANLQELLRVEKDALTKSIEYVMGAAVYRRRGQLLPLVELQRELQPDLPPCSLHDKKTDLNIVVIQADGCTFGLIVDSINDTEEIVVKPLGKQLKSIPYFAGATIMGDGSVALILDMLGLAQRARVLTEARKQQSAQTAVKARATSQKQQLILFEAGQGSRMAIPLSMVHRLEKFAANSIERSGGQEVVRYRDQIMPLIRVRDYVHPGEAMPIETEDELDAIVYSEKGRSVGLIVGRICDIVEETLSAKRCAKQNGIFGSAVIQDRVTDLLDVHSIINAANPFATPAPTPKAA